MALSQGRQVLIIGGGLAGMAAAAALAGRGLSIRLLESRPRLGGRASSFVDQSTGETIDNCQHVGMGCCTNLQHFCRTVGIADLFRVEKSLTFIGPDGSRSVFSAGFMPAPLHLAGAFARLKYLSLADKGQLARAVIALARTPADRLRGTPFLDWLHTHHQSPAVIQNVWEVILVSALSESLDRIDAVYARKVIVDGFLANRGGWHVHVPTVPLDDLYTHHAYPWLQEQGVDVQLRRSVERLDASRAGTITGVHLTSGEVMTADDYVVSVPFHRLPSLLPNDPRGDELRGALGRMESAPITSVHLWYDRRITELAHAVIVGRTSQWLFSKDDRATGQTGTQRHGYQVVISASREERTQGQQQLQAVVHRELAEVFPAARSAQVVHARTITEHRAVFSVTPGIDELRPPQQSPWHNLQLAGDWTRTGWPSTMEGAVRSGYLAARNVLARAGRDEALVQPDLPAAPLARILLGL